MLEEQPIIFTDGTLGEIVQQEKIEVGQKKSLIQSIMVAVLLGALAAFIETVLYIIGNEIHFYIVDYLIGIPFGFSGILYFRYYLDRPLNRKNIILFLVVSGLSWLIAEKAAVYTAAVALVFGSGGIPMASSIPATFFIPFYCIGGIIGALVLLFSLEKFIGVIESRKKISLLIISILIPYIVGTFFPDLGRYDTVSLTILWFSWQTVIFAFFAWVLHDR